MLQGVVENEEDVDFGRDNYVVKISKKPSEPPTERRDTEQDGSDH